MSESLIPSFLVSDVSELLRLLTKNERCEQIPQVAHQKWANEWIARFFERIAHSLIFGQKTSDLLGKPMSEFPALVLHRSIWKKQFNSTVFYKSTEAKQIARHENCKKFAPQIDTTTFALASVPACFFYVCIRQLSLVPWKSDLH